MHNTSWTALSTANTSLPIFKAEPIISTNPFSGHLCLVFVKLERTIMIVFQEKKTFIVSDFPIEAYKKCSLFIGRLMMAL